MANRRHWIAFGFLTCLSSFAVAQPKIYLTNLKVTHDDERIGKKSGGMLCTPAGSVSINDVIRPGDDLLAAVALALSNSGFNKVQLADSVKLPPEGSQRLTGRVHSVKTDLCAKSWLWGRAKNFKGRGSVTVDWRLADIATDETHSAESIPVEIDLSAKSLPAPILSELVSASAIKFIERLPAAQ